MSPDEPAIRITAANPVFGHFCLQRHLRSVNGIDDRYADRTGGNGISTREPAAGRADVEGEEAPRATSRGGSGDRASATDPLDDTNSCRVFSQCLEDESLIGNLMFVSPVSDSSGNFVRQNLLSAQQRSVMNRYIAVD